MEKSGIYNIVKEYHPIKIQIERLYCPCGTEMRYDRQITVNMPTTLDPLFYFCIEEKYNIIFLI